MTAGQFPPPAAGPSALFTRLQKTFLLLMVIVMFSGCNLQNRLLYYPNPSVPSATELRAAGLRLWEAESGDYRGLAAATESGAGRGTVVVFHGNGGTALHRDFYVQELSALGFRVILAEYPRYGGRPGALGEKAFVRDAAETVRRAARYGGPLYLLGESLGCGVASGVVRKAEVEIDGLILITPWESLAAIAQRYYPLLPVRLLLTDSYDNLANLGSYRGRIAVVGAEFDEVIPLEHARTLFAGLPGPDKRFWTIPRAGHNDWPYFTSPAWWQEIAAFVAGRE